MKKVSVCLVRRLARTSLTSLWLTLCLTAGPAPAQQTSPSDRPDASKGAAPSKTDAKQPASSAKAQGSPSVQGPQSGVSTIRVPVNLVNVLFTVTDKKNRMILDLTKDELRVMEDNKPQKISFFSR